MNAFFFFFFSCSKNPRLLLPTKACWLIRCYQQLLGLLVISKSILMGKVGELVITESSSILYRKSIIHAMTNCINTIDECMWLAICIFSVTLQWYFSVIQPQRWLMLWWLEKLDVTGLMPHLVYSLEQGRSVLLLSLGWCFTKFTVLRKGDVLQRNWEAMTGGGGFLNWMDGCC